MQYADKYYVADWRIFIKELMLAGMRVRHTLSYRRTSMARIVDKEGRLCAEYEWRGDHWGKDKEHGID